MDEEQRALVHRAQVAKQAAFRVMLTNLLVAPVSEALRVTLAWKPFKERTRHGEYSEPEETRPSGIVNG